MAGISHFHQIGRNWAPLQAPFADRKLATSGYGVNSMYGIRLVCSWPWLRDTTGRVLSGSCAVRFDAAGYALAWSRGACFYCIPLELFFGCHVASQPLCRGLICFRGRARTGCKSSKR